MSDPVTDKYGTILKEFDVVRIFHFTGRNYQRQYMHKWVRKNNAGNLVFVNLDDPTQDSVRIELTNPNDMEIISSRYGPNNES